MTHELEVFEDGTASFMGAREPAWHKHGITVPEETTREETIRLAQLDWPVTLEPVYTTFINDEGVTRISMPDHFATVRNHPKIGHPQALAIVGSRYVPIQNADAFQILDDIVDSSDAHYDSAGSIFGGRQVFMALKFPEILDLGGYEQYVKYLLATTSHDGSSSLRITFTQHRTVCNNTLQANLRAATNIVSLRHTANVSQRIGQAREALNVGWKYDHEFAEAAERLIYTSMSDGDWEEFVSQIFPAPPKDAAQRSHTYNTNQRELLHNVWNSPTQDGIRNTAWGAVQSVVEYVDWYRPVRGGDDAQALRSARVIDGTASELKSRALALVAA